MKKTLAKILAIVMCAVLLVSGSIYITLAYLQSQSNVVTNTFTTSNISLKLYETAVGLDGVPTEPATTTEKGNQYKLIPGSSYTKDPTVRVEAGSEPCYVVIAIRTSVFVDGNDIEAPYGEAGKIADQIKANGWNTLDNCTIHQSIITKSLEGWTDYTLYYYDVDEADNAGAIITAAQGGTALRIFDGFKLKNDLSSTTLDTIATDKFEVVAFGMQTTGYGEAFNAAATDLEKITIAFNATFGANAQ